MILRRDVATRDYIPSIIRNATPKPICTNMKIPAMKNDRFISTPNSAETAMPSQPAAITVPR